MSTETTCKPNTIVWADIPVTDLKRACKFYSAVLAAEIKVENSHGCEFGLLPHADNNVSGCLVASSDNKPSANGPVLYLSVEGRLDAAVAEVKKGGGKIVKDKHPIGPYGFVAHILDTEGNRVALHSQKG